MQGLKRFFGCLGVFKQFIGKSYLQKLHSKKGNNLYTEAEKVVHLRTQDVAVIGICAAVYAVIGRLTDLGLTFLGVAFYPAVIVPAVFAALFGPWVGGFGAGIGIFIRDVLFHGNAALSLVAGVPANFLVFFLIGYFATKEFTPRKTMASLLVAAVVLCISLVIPVALLPADFASYPTNFSSLIVLGAFVATVIVCIAAIAAVGLKWRQWSSYVVGSVVAQAIGAALLSVTVWGVSPLFLSYFGKPIPVEWILPIFVWTFATEIPFVLVLGPPIIRASQRAFPTLRKKTEPKATQ